MNTEPEQERRIRWRFVLLWCGSVAVVAFFVTLGALALTHGSSNGTTDGTTDGAVATGGTGTAPVLEEVPSDLDTITTPDPAPSGAASTTDPSREVQTRNAEGGVNLVPTPKGTSKAAALGPPREHGINLVMTSTLSEPLRPGFQRSLFVSVRNPNDFPVDLYRIDVRVDPSPVTACLTEWVHAGRYRYTGGTPRQIDGRSTVIVTLPIEMVNLVDVDQNACQNTTFPLRLSGVAVDPA